MKAKNLKSKSLNDFLSIGKDIIPETKNFLFQLMAETTIDETPFNEIRENRVYLILQLYNLLTGIEKESEA